MSLRGGLRGSVLSHGNPGANEGSDLVSPPSALFVIDPEASATTGLAPFSVSFHDQSSNSPTSWLWTVADGVHADLTSTSQHPNFEISNAGTYDVTLVATNAAGDSAPFTRMNYITVTEEAPPPSPSIGRNWADIWGPNVWAPVWKQ